MARADRPTRFDNPAVWDAEAWKGRKSDHDRAGLATEWLPQT